MDVRNSQPGFAIRLLSRYNARERDCGVGRKT